MAATTEEPDDPGDEPADEADAEGLRNTKRTRDQVAEPGHAGRRTREGGGGERRTREEGAG
jgi:hypothetical protein